VKPIIEVTGLSKRYRLGMLGANSLREEVEIWWDRLKTGNGRANKQPEDARDFWALRDVSFSVQAGEVVGIVGSNGAGKSTLLKILSRITEPSEGEALMRGRVASLLEVGTGFHPELSGRENIFLNGAILGMTTKEIRSRLDEIIDFSEVEEFLDTPVKRYSSGMYVRLAFAVAAHLEPEILIIDEVLAVGDAAFQKKCLRKMGDVAKGGRTVLFVSHNTAAITNLCSRCLLIEKGRLAADGGTREVVGAYLTGDLADTPFKELSPVDGHAFFIRVGLSRDDRTPSCCFDFHEPITVLMDFTLQRPLPGIVASFSISNANGEQLFRSAPIMANPPIPVEAAGIHSLAARIPHSLLLPGRYFVNIRLHRPKLEVYDRRDQVISFEITSNGFDHHTFSAHSLGHFFADVQWSRTDRTLPKQPGDIPPKQPS
jgi:lipopolysaccharide transport system ATP-binding protein